jgi:hypothetical protein
MDLPNLPQQVLLCQAGMHRDAPPLQGIPLPLQPRGEVDQASNNEQKETQHDGK